MPFFLDKENRLLIYKNQFRGVRVTACFGMQTAAAIGLGLGIGTFMGKRHLKCFLTAVVFAHALALDINTETGVIKSDPLGIVQDYITKAKEKAQDWMDK